MKVFVVLVLFVCQVFSQYSPQCYSEEEVPLYIDRSSNYPFRQAGLQLFTDLEIPCDGTLNKWSFLPRSHTINRLHLAIFRRVGETTYKNVGDTYINNYDVPGRTIEFKEWMDYPITPIKVSAGDMIGLYYDAFNIPELEVPIPSKELTDFERSNIKPTLVLMAGVISGSSVFDAKDAIKSYRVPALAATIGPQIQTTLAPHTIVVSTTPQADTRCQRPVALNLQCDIYRQTKRAFYDSTNNICLEYYGCQPETNFVNSFHNLEECISSCNSFNPFEICTSVPTADESCEYKTTRYYYDASSKTCGLFTGCANTHSSANNFPTSRDCNICAEYEKRYHLSDSNSGIPLFVPRQHPHGYVQQPYPNLASSYYHHHHPNPVYYYPSQPKPATIHTAAPAPAPVYIVAANTPRPQTGRLVLVPRRESSGFVETVVPRYTSSQ